MGKINQKTVMFIALLIIVLNLDILFFQFYDTIFPTEYVHIDNETKSRINEIVQNNDIFNSCLLLAKEYYEDIDIEQANVALDNIVIEIKARIKNTDSPQNIIEIISSYLNDEYQIEPDKTKVAENMLPDKVLKYKKGHCVGLTLLYLSIGEKLGLPLFGKSVPMHIFVYYDDGSTQFNIETTSKEFLQPDSYYDDSFPDPEQFHTIRKLNKRQVLAIFMNNLHFHLKKSPYSIDILKKALYLFPDSAQIHANLAEEFLLNNQKKAKSHLLKSLELNPTTWSANLTIAKLYYNTRDYKKASDYSIKSIDLLKKSVRIAVDFSGDIPEKEALVEETGRLLQNEEAEYGHLLGLGLLLFHLKEYELSNKLFAHALKLYPEKLKTHIYYAKTYFLLGNYEDARKHEQIARQASQSDDLEEDSLRVLIDNLADSHMILGQSYAMLKKYDLALANSNKAIEIGGPQSRYYCSLAGTYWLKGDKAEAIRYYETALEFDPSDTFIQEKLSELKMNNE